MLIVVLVIFILAWLPSIITEFFTYFNIFTGRLQAHDELPQGRLLSFICVIKQLLNMNCNVHLGPSQLGFFENNNIMTLTNFE